MTSDPGILTTTVYSWEYCTSTSSSAAPPLQLSPPTPITPGCSPCAPRLVMAPPGSATSLPPHCTCLSLGPHAAPVLQHLTTGQILPRPQVRWRAPPIPSCFPLQPHPLCLLCPACPDLEPLPDGSPSRCLIAIANTPVISRSFPHFFQLLPVVKSCLSFISQVLSSLRKFFDSSVWIYCFSYVLTHSFHKYFVSSYYVADVVLARGDIMVTEMDIVSVLTELSI